MLIYLFIEIRDAQQKGGKYYYSWISFFPIPLMIFLMSKLNICILTWGRLISHLKQILFHACHIIALMAVMSVVC